MTTRSDACVYCIEAYACEYDATKECRLSEEEYAELQQDAVLCDMMCPCAEE